MKCCWLAILILVASLYAPATLASCAGPTYSSYHTLDPDEQAVDTTPPGPVNVILVKVNRFNASEEEAQGCGDIAGDGCWVFASAVVTISADDDRTPAELLGYKLELVQGSLPEDAVVVEDQAEPGLPGGAVRAWWGGSKVEISWYDHRNDKNDPVSFAFTIRAVDLAGNEGPVSEPIEVYHPGFREGGCAVGGRSPRLFGWLTVVFVLFTVRRLGRGTRRRT